MEEKSVVSLDAMMSVNQALDFCKTVSIVEIGNNDQAERSGKMFRELKSHIDKLEATRKSEKEPHKLAGEAVDAFFKEAKAPLENLKLKLDQAIRKYSLLIEDKRREDQRKLDEKAAADRRKADEAARVQREKEEAAWRAEEEASARAAKAKNEVARQAALADAANSRRIAEKAAASAQVKEFKAETTVAAIAQVSAPAMNGIGTRSVLKYEISNPMAAIQWFIENKMYNLLEVNDSAAGAWAKSQGKEMIFPGGRIYKQVTTTGRAI